MTTNTASKTAATLWMLGAYVVAIFAAIAAGYLFRDQHPLAIVAVANVAATLVIFAFAVAFGNSSFYDPYWSVQPMVIAIYFVVAPFSVGNDLRQVVVTALVCIYGLRLTYNFLSGWPGLHHEDWRYVDLRESSGRLYWLVSFTGIMFVPTILVYGGSLPLFPAIALAPQPFGALDFLAAFVTAGAIYIEAKSDRELRQFQRQKKAPEEILATGLWAYSRHPNYFGEITFWWGLYLFALAADTAYWWTGIGPLAITLLFIFISIPMIDKRHLKRRPQYAEHMKRVSSIVPWFPKRA